MSFFSGSTLDFIGGAAVSLVQLLLVVVVAHWWSAGLFREANRWVRYVVSLVCCYWLMAAVIVALIPFGRFDRIWTTGVLALVAGVTLAWRGRGVESRIGGRAWGDSLTSLREFWGSLSGAAKWMTWGVGVVFVVRLARGMVAPPLAWDALTYHLLKAGRWVQTGGWVWDNAPDAWQFYEWFPPLGDVYWAWAMLGTHTDAWLALAGALIWVSCGAATFALARVLGAERSASWMAGLTAVSVPASLALLTASYVDSTAMAVVTLGSVLTLASVKARDPRLAAVGAVSMALAVGIKITFLPYLVLSGAVLVWLCVTSGRRGIVAGLVSIPAMAVGVFWQIYLVYVGKTPFYPAPLSIAGLQIEPGQAEFLKHHFPDKFQLPYLWEMPKSAWSFLFQTEDFSPTQLNFTWAFLLVAAAGIWGGARNWKSAPGAVRWVVLGLFGAGAAIFLQFWLPSTAFYRGIWLSNMGRFFLPWYALLVALAATLAFKYRTAGFVLVIAVNLFEAWPRAWVALDWKATLIGVVLLAILASAVYCLVVVRNGILKYTLAGCLLFGAAYGQIGVRELVRYDFYSATDKVYDTIYLGQYRFPWDALEMPDQDLADGVTIDFTSDYGGIAYRWFRYVLLGSHLQNKVIYVTPTTDGSVWSKSVTEFKPTDYGKWRERLETAGVDYIVTIQPFASELDWLPQHRDGFRVVAREVEGEWAVFKVVNDAITTSPVDEVSAARAGN